jgi:drug/metabolite transporter (DMT)-like permease
MNTQTITKHAYLNFALFALLALLWSGSFINIKIVVDVFPPVFSAMMRVLISFICFSLLFSITRKKIFLSPKESWRLWIAGIFTQALPFMLLFYGEKFIEPSLASIINSSVSLWALILGTLLFRDFSQWTPVKIIGLVLGLTGISLIFYPLIHHGENSIIGITAIMGMAISYAIGSLITQHVIFKKMQVSFETNLFQQHLASLLFLLISSLTLESWPAVSQLFNTKIILAFLYLGLMATTIAWMIYFYLIREWGAVRAASVMYIVPVLAIVWDLIFLHFIPTQVELIGTVAILLGVTLIQFSRQKKINA